MMLRTLLKRTARAAPTIEPSTLVVKYVDAARDRLRELQQQRGQVLARLNSNRPLWQRLIVLRDSPDAHQQMNALAPSITADETLIESLDRQIAATEDTIHTSELKVTAYAAFASETEAWLTPMLERLPSDDDIERAFRASHRLDREAHELLLRTEDRRFRRPLVDPYLALREALEDRLRIIERVRLMRTALNKTAS